MAAAPPYVAPAHKATAFNCPACGAYANQRWFQVMAGTGGTPMDVISDWEIAICAHCSQPSLWLKGSMIYPAVGSAPLPNADLSDDTRNDYEEARAIVNRSPRGAAALLRLTIQKLCKELGERGENINADVAALVKKGLLPSVQQSLDAVRVIGNNAVHPGQIDIRDDTETASALFRLVNLIADQLITAPKEAAALFSALPAATRDAIAKRDSTSGGA